jgi:hypothetical protein
VQREEEMSDPRAIGEYELSPTALTIDVRRPNG